MHASTNWLLPDRIILTTFCDLITMENITEGQETISHMLNHVSDPAHLVIEVIEGRQFSADLVSLTAIRQLTNPVMRHANLGWIVVVDPTPNPVFKMIGYTLAQVSRKQLHICETRDSALAFLYRKDQSLSNTSG